MSSKKENTPEEGEESSKPALRRSSRITVSAITTAINLKKPEESEEIRKIDKDSTDNLTSRRVSTRRLSSSSQNENLGTPSKAVGKKMANKIEKALTENGDTPKRVSTRRNSASNGSKEHVETPGRVSLRRNSNKIEKIQTDVSDTPKKIVTRRNSNKSEEKLTSSRSSSLEKDISPSQVREGSVEGSPRRSTRLGGKAKGLVNVQKNLDPILEDVLNKSATDQENIETIKPIAVNRDSADIKKEAEASDTEIDVVSLDETKTLPRIDEEPTLEKTETTKIPTVNLESFEENKENLETVSQTNVSKISLEPIVVLQKVELFKDELETKPESEENKINAEPVSTLEKLKLSNPQPEMELTFEEAETIVEQAVLKNKEGKSISEKAENSIELVNNEEPLATNNKEEIIKSTETDNEAKKLLQKKSISKVDLSNHVVEELTSEEAETIVEQDVLKLEDQKEKSSFEKTESFSELTNNEELVATKNNNDVNENRDTDNDAKVTTELDVQSKVKEADGTEEMQVDVFVEDNNKVKVYETEEKVLINETFECSVIFEDEGVEETKRVIVEDKLGISETDCEINEANRIEEETVVENNLNKSDSTLLQKSCGLSENESEEVSAVEPMEVDEITDNKEDFIEGMVQKTKLEDTEEINKSKYGFDLDTNAGSSACEEVKLQIESKVGQSYEEQSSSEDIRFHLTDEEEELNRNGSPKAEKTFETFDNKIHTESSVDLKDNNIGEVVEGSPVVPQGVIEQPFEKDDEVEEIRIANGSKLESSVETTVHQTVEDLKSNESDSHNTPKCEAKKSSIFTTGYVDTPEDSKLDSDEFNLKTQINPDKEETYVDTPEDPDKGEKNNDNNEEVTTNNVQNLPIVPEENIALESNQNKIDSEVVVEDSGGEEKQKETCNAIESDTSLEENKINVSNVMFDEIPEEKKNGQEEYEILNTEDIDVKEEIRSENESSKLSDNTEELERREKTCNNAKEEQTNADGNKKNKDKKKKTKKDSVLVSKIDELLESVDSESEEDEINSFIDDEAEEGEEDTPSEGSNDIPEKGEDINSSESEFSNDESYEKDSFIDDEEQELLSGEEEYDLSLENRKKMKHRIIAFTSDSDNETDIVPEARFKKSCKKKRKKSRIIKPKDSSDEEVGTSESVNDGNILLESPTIKNEINSDSSGSLSSKTDADLDKSTCQKSVPNIIILEDITLCSPDTTKICVFKTESHKNKGQKKQLTASSNSPRNISENVQSQKRSSLESSAKSSNIKDDSSSFQNETKKRKHMNLSGVVPSTPESIQPQKKMKLKSSIKESITAVEVESSPKKKSANRQNSNSSVPNTPTIEKSEKKIKLKSLVEPTSIPDNLLSTQNKKTKKRKLSSVNVVANTPDIIQPKKKIKLKTFVDATSIVEDALLNQNRNLVPLVSDHDKKDVDHARRYVQLKPSLNNGEPSTTYVRTLKKFKNPVVGKFIETNNSNICLKPTSSSASTTKFHQKDFKNKMLYDNKHVKRVETEFYLRKMF